jgi:hypothetical protein
VRDVDLIVAGSGSLAFAVLMSLAAHGDAPLRVVVVARNEAALNSFAQLAGALGCRPRAPLTVTPVPCDYRAAALTRLFSAYRPRVVLNLASLQSPWTMTPGWKRLVDLLGYGCTLPLQAALADRVLRAAADAHPDAHLVNGCYPDLVNRLLNERGIPVAGGIGNIAIVASVLRSRIDDADAVVLAHHAHVSAMIHGVWNGLPAPLAWRADGAPIPDGQIRDRLATVRLPADATLNSLTGALAAPMLRALSGRADSWRGHAPGVHGRLGGYPVRVDASGIHLALPPDVDAEHAEQMNHAYAVHDGVTVDGARYVLTRSPADAARTLGVALPSALDAWEADALDEQVALLTRLRDDLGQGPGSAQPG